MRQLKKRWVDFRNFNRMQQKQNPALWWPFFFIWLSFGLFGSDLQEGAADRSLLMVLMLYASISVIFIVSALLRGKAKLNDVSFYLKLSPIYIAQFFIVGYCFSFIFDFVWPRSH